MQVALLVSGAVVGATVNWLLSTNPQAEEDFDIPIDRLDVQILSTPFKQETLSKLRAEVSSLDERIQKREGALGGGLRYYTHNLLSKKNKQVLLAYDVHKTLLGCSVFTKTEIEGNLHVHIDLLMAVGYGSHILRIIADQMLPQFWKDTRRVNEIHFTLDALPRETLVEWYQQNGYAVDANVNARQHLKEKLLIRMVRIVRIRQATNNNNSSRVVIRDRPSKLQVPKKTHSKGRKTRKSARLANKPRKKFGGTKQDRLAREEATDFIARPVRRI